MPAALDSFALRRSQSSRAPQLPPLAGEGVAQIGRDWLKYSLQNLAENLVKLKLVDTGTLRDSLGGSVTGGDNLSIRLTYALYGKYLDMGVGRGMQAGVRRGDRDFEKKRNGDGQLLRHQRRPRQWYSREMARQRLRLAELVSAAYGRTYVAQTTETLPNRVNINF